MYRDVEFCARQVAASGATGLTWAAKPFPRASGEMVTAGVSKTPGGNSLPVRVRPRAGGLRSAKPARKTFQTARIADNDYRLRGDIDQPFGAKLGQRPADGLDR